MNNHPFISNNTNVVDESFFTATPTYVNGQNVFVSQEKQRKLFDSLNTSIVGLTPTNSSPINQFVPGNFIQAEKQYSPYGTLFTFIPQTHHQVGYPPIPQQTWPSSQMPFIPNPMLLRNGVAPPHQFLPPHPMFPPQPFPPQQQFVYRNCPAIPLRSPEYQEQLSQNPYYLNPQSLPTYKLRFHANECTSCSDLLQAHTQIPGSQGTPDFNNMAGVMAQQEQSARYSAANPTECINGVLGTPMEPICCNAINDNNTISSVKQLRINRPVKRPEQHVADVLEEQKPAQEENNKKSVSFCNCVLTKPDEANQTDDDAAKSNEATSTSDKSVDGQKSGNSKMKSVKKFFKKKTKKNDDEKMSSDNSEKEITKRKRNRRKKKKPEGKKEESEYESDTSDTESTSSRQDR